MAVTTLEHRHSRADHPPLRLGFASDFHAGPTTDQRLLQSAVTALQKLQPQVLLLGGDYVCLHERHVDALAERLGEVEAPLGRFAVLGNHDLWTNYRYIEERLERAGIELLTNRNVRLPAPYGDVWICGLDDHWSGTPAAGPAFAGAAGARIVIMHAPSNLLDIGDTRFEVAFSGHTHGGQIALPGGRAIVLPSGPLSRRYPRGIYDLGSDQRLVVCRGIGCSTLPFRFYSAPEVIACTVIGRTGS